MDRRRLMGNSAVKEIYHPIVAGSNVINTNNVFVNTQWSTMPNTEGLALLKNAVVKIPQYGNVVLSFLNNICVDGAYDTAIYSKYFCITKNGAFQYLWSSDAPIYYHMPNNWTTNIVLPISPITSLIQTGVNNTTEKTSGQIAYNKNGNDYIVDDNVRYTNYFITNHLIYNADLDNILPSKSPIRLSNKVISTHTYAILDESGNLYESDLPMYVTLNESNLAYMIWLNDDGLKNGQPISRNKNTSVGANKITHYSDGVSHNYSSCKANFDVRPLQWNFRYNLWNIVTW